MENITPLYKSYFKNYEKNEADDLRVGNLLYEDF